MRFCFILGLLLACIGCSEHAGWDTDPVWELVDVMYVERDYGIGPQGCPILGEDAYSENLTHSPAYVIFTYKNVGGYNYPEGSTGRDERYNVFYADDIRPEDWDGELSDLALRYIPEEFVWWFAQGMLDWCAFDVSAGRGFYYITFPSYIETPEPDPEPERYPLEIVTFNGVTTFGGVYRGETIHFTHIEWGDRIRLGYENDPVGTVLYFTPEEFLRFTEESHS